MCNCGISVPFFFCRCFRVFSKSVNGIILVLTGTVNGDCPALLICGGKDQAGSAKSCSRRWAKKEELPLCWIKDAGHNSNTDNPEEVSRLIRDFIRTLKEEKT